jgi:hypothetical protein
MEAWQGRGGLLEGGGQSSVQGEEGGVRGGSRGVVSETLWQ